MNLVELAHHTTDEEGAEAYLREHGILKTFGECPQSPKQQGLGVHNLSTFGCGYIGCSLKGMKELTGTPRHSRPLVASRGRRLPPSLPALMGRPPPLPTGEAVNMMDVLHDAAGSLSFHIVSAGAGMNRLYWGQIPATVQFWTSTCTCTMLPGVSIITS